MRPFARPVESFELNVERWTLRIGILETVSFPISGHPAGLDRETSAWVGPAGQKPGRQNFVSVPISRPPCAFSVTPLKVES